jgi:hypothetical protein
MLRRRLLFTVLCLILAAAVFYPRACSDVEKQSIVVDERRITVVNLTETGWSELDVWLNDHYRAQATQLAPGQRLDMPTRLFVAGWGQHFDPSKQAPFGVEVTAKGADGKSVRLVWGQGRRR